MAYVCKGNPKLSRKTVENYLPFLVKRTESGALGQAYAMPVTMNGFGAKSFFGCKFPAFFLQKQMAENLEI